MTRSLQDRADCICVELRYTVYTYGRIEVTVYCASTCRPIPVGFDVTVGGESHWHNLDSSI